MVCQVVIDVVAAVRVVIRRHLCFRAKTSNNKRKGCTDFGSHNRNRFGIRGKKKKHFVELTREVYVTPVKA